MENERTKAIVSKGKITSNATLKWWMRKVKGLPENDTSKIDLSEIIALTDIQKTIGKCHIEFQVKEGGLCGRSLEEAIKNVNRKHYGLEGSDKKLKTEMIVDGYSSFLLLDKDDKPKVALHIENEMRWAMKKYKKLYPEKPLPHITPHVFRHTFCTNMANAGMNIKTLQYVMGHSDVGVMLNVYTHASYDRAAEQMTKILDFKADMQGKQRKSS